MAKIVSKNYVYSALYQLLTIVAPLLTIPYVSRIFGAENLGIYSYTNAIAHYFLIFGMLGLSSYGSRTIAMNRNNKETLSRTFWEVYAMQIITSLASLFAFLGFIFFFSNDYKIYFLILIAYVSSSLTDINWFFHGLEKFRITVVGNTIIKLLSIACIFIFVKTPNDLWVYILIHALATLFASSILWFYLFKTVTFIRPSFNNILGHFKPNLILFIPVIAVSIYKYMDKIMLGGFSKIEAGYYENAEKLITLVAGFITSFGIVMLPKMSNLVATGAKEFIKDTIRESMRFVIGLSCAFSFGLSSIASVFVPIYFGDDFLPCVPIIYCLSFTLLFTSWSNVIRTQFLIPLKKDKIYLIAEFLGAAINLILNLILIRLFGAMGAVIGTIVAEATVTLFQTFIIHKEISFRACVNECLPFVFAGFLMFLFVKGVLNAINNQWLSLLLAVFSGAIIYLAFWIGYEKFIKSKNDKKI